MVTEVVSSQIYLAVVRDLDFIVRLLDGFEEGNDQISFLFFGVFFFGKRITLGAQWLITKLESGFGKVDGKAIKDMVGVTPQHQVGVVEVMRNN